MIGNNTAMPISKMKQNVIMKLHAQDLHDVEDWQQLDAQIKKLTADRDAIINKFKIRMEAAGAHVCQYRTAVLVERKITHQERVDVTRLRAERPDIVSEYTKVSDTWRPAYVS